MDLIKYIGQRIREFRTSYGGGSGISQQALAKALGIASNTVSRWETGTYQPTINDLDRLAHFFGKSIFEFWPDQNIHTERDERIQSLVRAAEHLPDEEVEELKRYAEYRKAQHIYTKRTVGRKAKK